MLGSPCVRVCPLLRLGICVYDANTVMIQKRRLLNAWRVGPLGESTLLSMLVRGIPFLKWKDLIDTSDSTWLGTGKDNEGLFLF